MSTTTAEHASTSTRIQLTRRAYLLIGLVGIIAIPMGLSLAFNSWEAPDAEDYVRMAFATVAGQTIALVTSWSLLIVSFAQRARGVTTVLTVVTALVTGGALAAFDLSAENLLRILAGS